MDAAPSTTPQPIKDSILLIHISLLPDLGFSHGNVQMMGVELFVVVTLLIGFGGNLVLRVGVHEPGVEDLADAFAL